MTTKAPGSFGNPLRLLMRIPVPWVFVLTYLVGVALEFARPSRIPTYALLGVGVVGGVLFLTGCVIAAWSLLIFRKAHTTTVPGKASSTLVTWGPYRFSRNPMYVALAVAYLGEAGILRQLWPLACLPLTLAYINWIVVPVEEARLRDVFGATYEQYKASVRRWI
jgi:protein-S-isoprenylcysteine O-methyltransferase Ste14